MRRTCGHGRLLTHACPACIMRIRPDDYWEMAKLCRKRARDRGRSKGLGAG
jgi:hypothetical protein